MWSALYRFIPRLRRRRRSPVEETLSADAKGEALKEARFLFAQGAWARELLPGESPDDAPEIGSEPIEIDCHPRGWGDPER